MFRRRLRLLLAAFVAGAALPLAAWIAAQTELVEEALRAKLVSGVESSVRGELEIGRLEIEPTLAVRLEDVRLVAPDGAEAIRADEAHLHLDWRTFTKRRVVVGISALRPVLDLTPAEDGTTALGRALAPDVAAVEEEESTFRAVLGLSLAGGELVRRAPPGDTEGTPIRLERVGLHGEVVIEAGKQRTKVTGSGLVLEPVRERLGVTLDLRTGGGELELRSIRATAGGSRLAGREIRFGEKPTGSARGRFRAEDLAEWTGRPIPEDISVELSSDEKRAELLARTDGGAMLWGWLTREPDGTLRGEAVAREVRAPAWGIGGVEGSFGAHARGTYRSADRAWSVDVTTSPFGFRGARVEALTARAEGVGGERITATVSRFGLQQGRTTWRLAKDATLVKRGEVIEIRDLALTGPGGQVVSAEGRWPPSPRHPFVATAKDVALEEIPPALLPRDVRPRGRLEGVVVLTSPPRAGDAIPEGRISLRLRNARPGVTLPHLPEGPLDLVANAVLGERRGRVTADLRASSGESLRASADVPLRWPFARERAHVDLRAEGFRIGHLRDVGGRAHVSLAGDRLLFFVGATGGGREVLRAAGAGRAELAKIARERRIPHAAIWIERIDAGALAMAGLLPEGLTGSLQGAVAADASSVRAWFSADGVRFQDVGQAKLAVAARVAGGDAFASVRLLSADAPSAEPRRRREAGERGALGVTALLDPPLPRLLTAADRRIRFAARGAFQGVRLEESLAEGVPPSMSGAPEADARIALALALDGTGASDPRGWAWGSATNVVVEGQRAGRAVVAAHLRGREIVAWVGADGEDGGRLAAVARTARREDVPLREMPFSVAASARGFSLESLSGLLADHASEIAGRLDFAAVLTGSISDPRPVAWIELREGSVRTPDTGRLREITLDARVTPREIVVSRLIARGPRGGPLTATVRALRGGPRKDDDALPLVPGAARGWTLEGQARAKNFTIEGRRFGGSFDGNARMRGRLDQPLLTARIELDEGVVKLPDVPEKEFQPLDDHPDFVVVSTQDEPVAVAGAEGAPPAPALQTKLHLVAPGNLRVTGRDVDLLLSADLTVETGPRRAGEDAEGPRAGDDDAPRLTGEVRALRGSAKVAGKKFTVEHAHIGFGGQTAQKARLDIAAVHVVEASTPDNEDTKVTARVGGTVEDPTIQLTSDPPMPEDAVVSLLFLGATTPRSRDAADGGENPSLAGRAATLLGNYLTTRFRDQVQDVVPVDVLELETGSPGSAAEGRLRVGKYLAPGLFLSYARAFGAGAEEGVNSVRLEWQLRRRWEVVSEITDGNRGHVDLVWTREF